MSDDDGVLMPPGTYQEFVVPHNSRILKAVGGDCKHYCGNASHQVENFLQTEGLFAIKNYTLHDIPGVQGIEIHVGGRHRNVCLRFRPDRIQAIISEFKEEMPC
jgi:hypothetical protein